MAGAADVERDRALGERRVSGETTPGL